MGKLDIDRDVLREMLSRHFSAVGPLRQLVEGEDSRAFSFDADEGAFVLRVNRRAEGFGKDRLAQEVFAGPGLPIPVVKLIAADGGYSLCVSERLAGETLQALPAGGAFAYGQAVGQLLDALATLDVGALGENADWGTGRSWAEFLTAVESWTWRGLAGGELAVVKESVAGITDIAAQVGGRRGVVHGDFGSNNVLVQAGRVTGLIDWSEAMVGDPLYDLANLLFWRPWLDCMEQQCRYFERHEPHRLAEGAVLTGYQLRIGLQILHEALDEDDGRMVAWALERCRAILETD